MKKPSLRSPWGRLTLRAKTVVVALIPLVVLGLVVPAVYATQRSSARVIDEVERGYRLRQGFAAVLQDLVDAETGMRGFLLTNDKRFLQPYNDGLDNLSSDLEAVRRKLDGAQATRNEMTHLEELITRRLEILQNVRLFAKRTRAGKIPLDLLAEGRQTGDEIRASIARLDTAEARVLAILRSELERSRQRSLILSVVVVPLTLLLATAIVLLFATGLVRRVKRIEENARRLERGEPLLDPPSGDDELARLDRVLSQAAVRIAQQDAELRELALVDPLTGLSNRRAFLEIAEHELQVALRTGSVMALLFLDVDGLKRVNDELGHPEGDRMLKETASVLREALRTSDVVARLGGDEFCVLLSRDTAMDGAAVLERLDHAVASRNQGGRLGFTLGFSIGLAYFDPAKPTSIGELIREADAAMYEVKRGKAGEAQRRAAPQTSSVWAPPAASPAGTAPVAVGSTSEPAPGP